MCHSVTGNNSLMLCLSHTVCVERTHECKPAGPAMSDIPADSRVWIETGWEPGLTSHRALGVRGQSQDSLHLYS